MPKWENPKKFVPLNCSYVTVKSCVLFWREYDAYFINGYFVREGQNISRWVRGWQYNIINNWNIIPDLVQVAMSQCNDPHHYDLEC